MRIAAYLPPRRFRDAWYGIIGLEAEAAPMPKPFDATTKSLIELRPAADGPRVSGREEHHLPEGGQYLWFEYGVVRAWQIPVAAVLAGGLGTLPLAPLADVPQAELPGVIRQMEARIRAEAPPETAGVLWTATYVLMGLRYSDALAERLLEGVRDMKNR